MTSTEHAVEHLDVLIVGAGISGIGAAYYLQRDHPQRSRSPSWRPAARPAAPGTCSATPASGRTRTCTPSATSSSRGGTSSRSPAPTAILAYLRETAAENGIDAPHPLHHRVRRARPGRASDARWTVDVERTDTGERTQLTCRLAVLRRRLLPLRRGLHPAVRGPGALRGPRRASAALARGPRLRRQAGRRHRQRRHRGHARAGDGRHGRARDDAAAHADLRAAGAAEGPDRRTCCGSCSARSAGYRAHPAQEHRPAAGDLAVLPALPARGPPAHPLDQRASSCPTGYPGRRALQPALRPVGPAAVRRPGRRPVQGHPRAARASVVTDRIDHLHRARRAAGVRAGSWRPTSSSPPPG